MRLCAALMLLCWPGVGRVVALLPHCCLPAPPLSPLLLLLTLLLLLLRCCTADAGVLQALEEGKSEEEALKMSDGSAIASPAEQHSSSGVCARGYMPRNGRQCVTHCSPQPRCSTPWQLLLLLRLPWHCSCPRTTLSVAALLVSLPVLHCCFLYVQCTHCAQHAATLNCHLSADAAQPARPLLLLQSGHLVPCMALQLATWRDGTHFACGLPASNSSVPPV